MIGLVAHRSNFLRSVAEEAAQLRSSILAVELVSGMALPGTQAGARAVQDALREEMAKLMTEAHTELDRRRLQNEVMP